MKKILLILLFSCCANLLQAQCLPDRHNTSWFDGWLSCETSPNPNEARGESHWISYDFGQLYSLGELKIWNVNDPDILSYGAKQVAIDYSLDGINWIEYGLETFPIASGLSTYEGEVVTNFNDLKTRYLLLTVVDNYGGECSGFSEIRIEADSAKDENEDICLIADVYPNPFTTDFAVFLQKKCLGDVYIAIEDATGQTVVAEEIIKVFDTKTYNAKYFAPGVYFVCLRNGDIKERYKIVKY